MAVNKVVVNTENGAETLIDLTSDSVTSETLVKGVTAHDASGEEIVGTLSVGDNIPDYWNTHLESKIADIKELQGAGGKDCFSFVFITDVHYPSNLGKCSPALAKKIADECNIRFVLNGGDNQTRGCYQTKEQILSENKQLKEMFAPIKDKVLQVEGNHDGSYYWSGGTVGSGTSYVKQLTEQEMFEEYYRANGLNGDVHFDENSNAFYVDDVSNKVRYIGLNSMNVPNSKTDVDENGVAIYNKFRNYQFLQAQYDFLCNEALVTVPSDAWSVVVFGHSGIYNTGDYAIMVDVLSAYKNKTNCIAEYAGTAGGGADNFTNLFDVNGDGYKYGYNFKTDKTEELSSSNFITNYIPVTFNKTKPNVVRISGIPEEYRNTSLQVLMYNSEHTPLSNFGVLIPTTLASDFVLADDVFIWNAGQTNNYMSSTNAGSLAYIRISCDINCLDSLVVTVNEEITYTEGNGNGYDYVSVNHDFTNAKGKFVAYFHGHDHKDADYTRDSIKDIATRCDGVEEHDEADRNVREAGKITEQSFDVFTVNKGTNTIYATKIGAGEDREISY